MSDSPAHPPVYTPSQRLVALGYGVLCHTLFALGVGAMMWMLYVGLADGIGPFRGVTAAVANTLLLLHFPVVHSYFLSGKGRAKLARLAPLGLGKDLGTTLYAILSSLQLLLVFALWSPTGVAWFEFQGTARIVSTVLYVGSWIFLLRSMADAGLGIQTGSLGWSAVARGQKPSYKPFAAKGVFKFSRQPIYLAFSLILWTGPVWTPDHFVLALAWTLYCLVGPVLKEKRYLKYYGARYRLYQAMVPYWFPLRAAPGLLAELPGDQPLAPTPGPGTSERDVLIVGAGPVGLLLANLLAKEGLSCLVVEKRAQAEVRSMAIGITPPSLQILSRVGLDGAFKQRGVRVAKACVHGDTGLLGSVSFSGLPSDHPYILSLPQVETIRILRERLDACPGVEVRTGAELVGFRQDAESVTATLRDAATGKEEEVTAAYLAGCDGYRSAVRNLAGIRVRHKTYRPTFRMADFEDRSGLGTEAHLFFRAEGSVESFPLPGGRRRWIVLDQKGRDATGQEDLAERVHRLTGFDLRSTERTFESPFAVNRMLCETYTRGRAILCGDAAHVMSPIGGQGMNTGFADAELLARVMRLIRREEGDPALLLRRYEVMRRRAFRVAADRAARGMWLGTRTGRAASACRRVLIRFLLDNASVKERLAPYFAMLTVPFNNLTQVPRGIDQA